MDLDAPIGRLSRMDAIAAREMAEAGRRQQEQQLGQVRRALEEIDGEDYGLCRVCEEPIAFRRLQVRPFALVCLGCAAARERG